MAECRCRFWSHHRSQFGRIADAGAVHNEGRSCAMSGSLRCPRRSSIGRRRRGARCRSRSARRSCDMAATSPCSRRARITRALSAGILRRIDGSRPAVLPPWPLGNIQVADATGVCGVGRHTSSMREMAVDQGFERRDQPDEEGNRCADKPIMVGS